MKKLRIQAPRFLCFSSDQRFHFNMTSEKHLARPTSPGQVDLPLGNSWLGDRGDQPVGTKHECAINLRNHCNSLRIFSFVSSTQSSISPGDWQWPPLLSNQASYSFNLMFISVLAHPWAPRRKHVGKNLLQFWDILVTTDQWETGEFRPPPVLHDTVGRLETGEKVVEPSADLSQMFPWRNIEYIQHICCHVRWWGEDQDSGKHLLMLAT